MDDETTSTQAHESDPIECPHIRTAAEWIASRPVGQKLEDALAHAADWASRNAPDLYTAASAVDILTRLFKTH